MIGVAVTSAELQNLKEYEKHNAFKTALKLCENTEKISSFCGDVVGDICGILSGAGGISLVLSMNITEPNIYFIVTCLVSSIIAGLTIFSKAIFKGYAVSNAEKVVIKTASILDFSPKKVLLKFKIKKNRNQKKSNRHH